MSSRDAHNKRVTQYLTLITEFMRRTGRPFPFLLKVPASKTDIISRLHGIKADKKWYWKSRDSHFEIGGVGTAYTVDGNSKSPFVGAQDFLDLPPNMAPIFVGGKRFTPGESGDSIWSDFPDETLFIPEASLVREDGSYSEVCCQSITTDADDHLSIDKHESRFIFGGTGAHTFPEQIMPEVISVEHHPDYHHWRRKVENCLEAIRSDSVEKVVLARRTDYQFENKIDPLVLLKHLTEHHRYCFAMLYQPRPDVAFISVSPERLYRRNERMLEVEALSSTILRGATPDEDRRLENELLSNHKLRHEHQLVIDGVIDAAAALCQPSPEIGETAVMKLDRIQHLITPINGHLRDDIHDSDIIAALHPTPAVGGTPRDAAISKIAELEGFDRGWYAGPVGYITPERAEFVVGIRSLLVHGKTVSVFTGAGIVAGSDPDAEWQEIDSKDVLQPTLSGKAIR